MSGVSDTAKRDDETVTQFTVRQMRAEFFEHAACACGLEDICDPTCFSHPDHPDNKDRTETKTGVPEVKLEPGWLARDILRAIARLKEWGLV